MARITVLAVTGKDAEVVCVTYESNGTGQGHCILSGTNILDILTERLLLENQH